MPAWILAVLKYLPGLGGILEKIGQGSAKAEELRAEAELEEAKALKKGIYAPRYIKGYVLCALTALVALLMFLMAFFPESISLEWQHIVDAVRQLTEGI